MLIIFQVWVFHYEWYHELPVCPYNICFSKKIVELFYDYDTVDGRSVPQVVVDNKRNRVVYNFSDYNLVFLLERFVFGINILWSMGGTW